MKHASFWNRFFAAVLDIIIVNIISALVGFVIGFIVGIAFGASEPTQGLASILGGLAGIIIGWLYSALMESSSAQATLGKQALGIKVTGLDYQQISFGRATGRHFAEYLSGLTFLIGYIMAAFTKKKQALHDIIAGTLVVKTKSS